MHSLIGTNGLINNLGDNMNGFKVLILKDALDKICEELFEELSMSSAEKAIKIVKRNINKAISKMNFFNHKES